MKLHVKFSQLQLLTLSAAVLGLLLRIVLFTTGMDQKGMLISGHWSTTGLLALSVMICGLLIPGCALLSDSGQIPGRFHRLAAGAGCFGAAAAFLMSPVSPASGSVLPATCLGFLCATAFVFIGINRCLGKQPHFLAHVAVCLGFAIRMVSQYRLWSSDPQLADYCFYMISLVALMLTAYHSAAFDAGMGGFRRLRFFGLISVYFCAVSLWGSDYSLFTGLCGFWVLTNLPCFQSPADSH